MVRSTHLLTFKVASAAALILCFVALVELSWRVYGLGLVIESQLRFPPMSAEAMSTKAAPLLRAATNADPIYSIVQSQHVDLQQQHDFIIAVADSARTSALIGATCAGLVLILLGLAYFAVVRHLVPDPEASSRGTDAA